MTTAKKTTTPDVPKSLVWFEHEILAHTPQVGILDAASLGVYTIAEASGRLSGAWKLHRVYMQDLATDQVAATLGELLGAVVQMAHAVGVSLETLAEGQVQRVHTAPVGVRHRKAAPAEIPAKASTGGEDIPIVPRRTRSSKRAVSTAPSEHAASRRGRTSTKPQAEATPALLTKPARSTARTAKAGSSPSPASSARGVVPPAPVSRQRRKASAPVQPVLLESVPAAQPRKKPAAAPAKRARSSGAS